jgi:hypothetical protein
VTVHKSEDDLKPAKEGPELINAKDSDETVKALVKKFPKAKNIEKLPSGVYAVRFHKKRAKYLKGAK